jgi:serine protease AprX
MPRIASRIRSFLVVCAILALPRPAAAQTTLPAAPSVGGQTIPAPATSGDAQTTSTSAQATSNKLDPLLRPRASMLTGWSRVIVRATDANGSSLLPQLIQQLGGTPRRRLPIIEAVAASVPHSALTILANDPLVRRVALDRVVRGALERTSATVGATAVREQFGYDGAGVGIAVIDSGVTPWHDDLTQPGAPGSQRVDHFVDFVNGRAAPYDDYGHGTHVAGIIAGNGFDYHGVRAGIAPGARLQILKVLDGSGRGRISDVIGAIDYVVTNQAQFHTRIINLSVAAGVFESYESDLLTLAAKRAVDGGLVVVASAGNAGRNSRGRTAYAGVTAPGNAPWVLTVGASSTQGSINRGDDLVAPFSSRGPTAIDRRAKPDVLAPGVGIVSLSAPDSALFASKSAYLLNGTVATPYLPYLSLSGTSQAAPVVTGTVALMLQANPLLTPNAVKAILQYTAEEYAGYDALTQGAGFLNARGAVELARYFAAPLAASYPSAMNWSRQILWGNHRVRGGLLTPSANAWESNVLWGASSAPGGEPITWGVRCSAADCSSSTNDRWGTICATGDCGVVFWGDVTSENVVWGWTCGGADCNAVTTLPTVWTSAFMPGSTPSAASTDGEDTVVWGTQDGGDTVVWGTADDGDTVVWGTTDGGDTVVWGTTDDDTVVWGTTDDGTVVWGTADDDPAVFWDTSCEDQSFAAN